MDAAWFKAQQKRAGVTIVDLGEAIGRDRSIISRFYTGRQTMTLKQAEQIAAALDVPLAEVVTRAGLASASTAQELQPGFNESEAAVWIPRNDATAQTEKAVAAALGLKSGMDVWTVRGRSLALAGYLPGDRVLVDGKLADVAKSGDFVIAQAYDLHSGTATTLLRQYQRPALISHSPDPSDWRVYIVDDDRVTIRGVVTASWRGTSAAA